MLKSFLDIIARLSPKQDGQVLVLGAGVFILCLAALMISVDVGYWLTDKRDAQNDADAIALAAVQELGQTGDKLTDEANAVVAGEAWAIANNIDPAGQLIPPPCAGDLVGNFCFEDKTGDGRPDLVRVQVSRPSGSFIADAFGVATPTLSPRAAAARQYAVGACIMPWGIVAQSTDPEAYYGLNPTIRYVFQDTDANTPGNFGAITAYGTGNDVYKDTIRGECETGPQACAPADGIVPEGESLQNCQPKTGRLGATTANTLQEVYGPLDGGSPGPCDAATYAEAVYKVENGCLARAVPLSIINAFPPQGSSGQDVQIYGIANFYLAGWSRNTTCFPEGCGFVWGYLMLSMPANPAWDIHWGNSNNPFAPVVIALVE